MVDLPELTKNPTKTVKQTARNLLAWLPDPHKCKDCDVFCEATVCYHSTLRLYVDAWECPECENKYIRDEEWSSDNMVSPNYERRG